MVAATRCGCWHALFTAQVRKRLEPRMPEGGLGERDASEDALSREALRSWALLDQEGRLRRQQGELRSRKQALEVAVETCHVFTLVNGRRREPCVGDVIGGERVVDAQLAQHVPLGTQIGALHARCGQQRVDEAQGLGHGSRVNEDCLLYTSDAADE